MKNRPPFFRYLGFALLAIIADQISKWLILQNFTYRERVNIIPGFFDLTLVFNPGAAFSFLAGAGGWQKYFFLALAAVICTYLLLALKKNQFGTWGSWGAAAIIGGALGNVIDRLLYGHVVDFLLFYFREHYYPAFNLADSLICIGAFLIIAEGFTRKKLPEEKKP